MNLWDNFLEVIYLFERGVGERHWSSTFGSLLRWLQQSAVGQMKARSFFRVPHAGAGPRCGAVLCCFPRHVWQASTAADGEAATAQCACQDGKLYMLSGYRICLFTQQLDSSDHRHVICEVRKK